MEVNCINSSHLIEDCELPPLSRLVVKALKRVIREIKSGDIEEERLAKAIGIATPSVYGYFREDDYLSADQSMKLLGLGKNRQKFFYLIKTYRVNACTFKGVKIGYEKNDIYRLKSILENKNK